MSDVKSFPESTFLVNKKRQLRFIYTILEF